MSGAYRRYLWHLYAEKEARKEERAMTRALRDPFDLPTEEFFENYKVSREMTQYVCQALDQDLAPKINSGLSTTYKVLSSLKVLMSGNYQRGVGNEERTCIAQRTVSKYLHQFLESIQTRLTPYWIQFPGTQDAREQISARFEQKFNLPNILGCIDCTHVQIFPPKKPANVQFLNRHGDTSINVQLISDADCRILNVNANWPGRVHDQFIFNQCLVKEELQRLYRSRIGQYHLLGDSGYALEPWLMTPIRNAELGSPERAYTDWHCQTRNSIERTNGSMTKQTTGGARIVDKADKRLKGTFRCLGIDRSIHYSHEQASKIITACCTLYNIMKYFRIPMQFVPPTVEERAPMNYEPRLYNAALQKRAEIVRTYFT